MHNRSWELRHRHNDRWNRVGARFQHLRWIDRIEGVNVDEEQLWLSLGLRSGRPWMYRPMGCSCTGRAPNVYFFGHVCVSLLAREVVFVVTQDRKGKTVLKYENGFLNVISLVVPMGHWWHWGPVDTVSSTPSLCTQALLSRHFGLDKLSAGRLDTAKFTYKMAWSLLHNAAFTQWRWLKGIILLLYFEKTRSMVDGKWRLGAVIAK